MTVPTAFSSTLMRSWDRSCSASDDQNLRPQPHSGDYWKPLLFDLSGRVLSDERPRRFCATAMCCGNPPWRAACTRSLLRQRVVFAAPRAVYVSRNPEMLAVELRMILKYGYTVERIEAVDMFPHTEHIETLVHLGA